MTSSAARAQLLRTEPAADVLQIELYAHGPQWQRRIRFAMGTPARMVGHGQAFCSAELAELIVHVFQLSGLQCRIADRSGPSPVFYRSGEERPHVDERREARDERMGEQSDHG